MMMIFLSFLFSLTTSIFSWGNDSSSGCGLGWMVFKDNSLVSSSLRATTNTTFLNTVAMTFGTSGCAKHKIVKKEQLPLYFANNNFDQLTLDMAKGEGPYLSALAYTLGCTDLLHFSSEVQSRFSDLASKKNGEELLTSLRKIKCI